MATDIDYRGPERFTERMRRWVREWGRGAMLFFGPWTPEKYGQLYDYLLNAANSFGEGSLYLNLGHWKGDPETIDEASDNLVRLVATEACLGPHDVVVDVGCGFGDPDFLWAREFGPSEIIGVNVSRKQIEIANERSQAAGISSQVHYMYGAADNLPQRDSSATKVVAVESAFHFPSRTRFFGEAFRVLQPGGRLVTADIVALSDEELSPRTMRLRPVGRIVREVFMNDRSNQMDSGEYESELRIAGFRAVKVYSIRQYVYAPYAKFMRKRLRDPDMRRVNPAGRIFFGPIGVSIWGHWLDYIVAVADKPLADQNS